MAGLAPKSKAAKLPSALWQALNRHFIGSQYLESALFKKLMRLKPEYPKLLEVPSDVKHVYRLMVNVDARLAKSLGCVGDGGLLKGGTYKPLELSTSSSWTSDLGLYSRGKDLSFMRRRVRGTYMLLLEAPVDHSKFLGNPGVLSDAVDCDEYNGQMEVIGQGRVPLSRIAYTRVRSGEHKYERELVKYLQTGKVVLPFVVPDRKMPMQGDSWKIFHNGKSLGVVIVAHAPSLVRKEWELRLIVKWDDNPIPDPKYKNLVSHDFFGMPEDLGMNEYELEQAHPYDFKANTVLELRKGERRLVVHADYYVVDESECHVLYTRWQVKRTRPKNPQVIVHANHT